MKKQLLERMEKELMYSLSPHQLKELKEVFTRVFEHVDVIPCKQKKSFEEKNIEVLHTFIAAKQIEGCSSKTLAYYKQTVMTMLNSLHSAINEISTTELRNYLSEYQKKNKSSRVTIDNIRRILSSFFGWLEDEDYIIKSPVRRIHKIKMGRIVKEVLSDEELENLRDVTNNIRDLAMIDLLASTGMRVGELVRINIDEIKFHDRSCIVFGKGNSEREVYFDARSKLHLKLYLSSRSDKSQALFVSLHSPYRRLTVSGIEKRLRLLGQKADIPKLYPHKFRRSLATRAIDKGMAIEQVQCLLGHTRIDTTLQYAMVKQANVKLAHRKYIG